MLAATLDAMAGRPDGAKSKSPPRQTRCGIGGSGNVHVALSYALADPAAKREQLRKAEALATIVREGDRDFALRWVFEGYRHAGFNDDAERLRGSAAMDPEGLSADWVEHHGSLTADEIAWVEACASGEAP